MEPEELLEFQEMFASVDTSDPLSIRNWFESYPELTADEQYQITGRTKNGIARLKRKAGVARVTFIELEDRIYVRKSKFTNLPTKPPQQPKKPLPDIDIPEDWATNPEWIHHCLCELKISKNQLMILLGCGPTKIKNLLIKYADPGLPQDIMDFINGL